MKKQTNAKRLSYLISVLVLLVMAVILIPQADTISGGIRAIRNANPIYVAGSLAAVLATYFMAALTLQYLALKPLRYAHTLLVQFASGFATKLVPAGIGGFAINTRYLVKSKHSVVQASSVMALNGLLGFAGHMIILMLSAAYARQTLDQAVSLSVSPTVWLIILAVISTALTCFLVLRPVQVWTNKTVRDLWAIITAYKHKQLRLIYGFFGACSVTALFTAALYLCALSLGVHLSFLEVILVYTAGSIGTAVVPTPGGIGGAEAALAAALITIGVDTSTAVSLAILFRLVAFWLPILPGFFFFQLVLRRRFI